MTSATNPTRRTTRRAAKLAVGVSGPPSIETPSAFDSRPTLAEQQLNSIALASAADICARLRISRSSWLARVAAGEAPPPAIKSARFTRWRVADIAAWIESQAARKG